jgi:hypothetical protein
MRTSTKTIGWIAVILAALIWRQFGPGLPTEVARGDAEIAAIFAQHRSHVMVEFSARVQRLLLDDLAGVSHQRFIAELDNGHVLLILHDLDHAKRVPLELWDMVNIRGEYKWDAQGGIVSWTHRDPGFGLKHGWIEHKGNLYE